MAAESEELEPGPDVRALCDDLAGRVGIQARRAVIELVVEDGRTKALYRKERFAASELAQFDRDEQT